MNNLRALNPERKLRNWYFTKEHRLFGYIHYDSTGMYHPGELHEVQSIVSVSQYRDFFIVKTAFACYHLESSSEQVGLEARVEPNKQFLRRYHR